MYTRLRSADEFKNLEAYRSYLKEKEGDLLDSLRGTSQSLKADDIKHFVPELAKAWKRYLNTPGVTPQDQKRAIVHCAQLVLFSQENKCAKDYLKVIQGQGQIPLSSLENELLRPIPSTDEMILVRDLRF